MRTRLFKYVLKTLLWILGIILSYLLIAAVFSILGTRPGDSGCTATHEVYIFSNAVHLNFTIPVHLLDTAIVEELDLPPDVRYLSFGWGDKEFYIKTPTWDDLNAGVVLKAVFIPGASAIHTTYYRQVSADWVPVHLCDTQLAHLTQYIHQTFERDSQKRIIEIPHSGYSRDDRFFEAHGRYSLFNTCNDWVNRGLKRAQVKTSIWSPFKYGVLYHVN